MILHKSYIFFLCENKTLLYNICNVSAIERFW